ncbi:MAG TPA: efflux RND transporter periplasmic adaptor subunit [Candidatus Hydrogenedens sp.]|nr:efflux RND transporter periplasmic adaptor subunit [Candidatus Hydrogenedens sp.]HOK09063.1 efflux RND transporter periplasmic adaptor subunit [Candidatus Hydrogenedens sp.]HOL19129.1 efflux RND transporter periplasmic adaptor subunit [Candidatus Hydrogenedens sp.]HPP58771.1 efflux RND transporter periplasmic adaptor subunit [Candidatus Hydrogenedens sp.]
MRHPRLVAFFMFMIGLFVVSFLSYIFIQPQPFYLQGEVETDKINVSAKVPGRLLEIIAEEGQNVKKGEIIAILDRPQLEAKRKQAESAQKAAQAQFEKAEKGAREEQIRMAQNQWLQAQAGRELAEKSFQRIQKLFEEGVVPAQKRDEVEAQYKMACRLEATARAQYDMALNGTREEDKKAAEALVQQASGAVQEVDSLIEEVTVTAPVDGEILEHIVYPGEIASAGMPILTMINPDKIWVTFNIREDQLKGLKKGQVIAGMIPALNRRILEMEVYYISPLGEFATWRATSASGGFDLRTFEVRAKPLQKLEGLRPGMSVVVPWERPDKEADWVIKIRKGVDNLLNKYIFHRG